MNNKFIPTRSHGLALTVVILSLAGINGLAQSSNTPANPTITAASAMAPAPGMPMPSLAKATPPAPASAVNEDIHDIRGPVHLPSPWRWPLWLAGGAALAVLLYAGWLWNRRRNSAAVLLPYEIALARLAEARSLMQPENAREFSITVSEIIRHYIEVRFRVWAARRTTEEFLHDVVDQSDAMLTNHRELLDDFLGHCDLAKFARWILSAPEMETMLQSAHTFVLETGRAAISETKYVSKPPIPEKLPIMVEPLHATLNSSNL